jgi:tRNA (mo5U34)-methyltransferase
MTAPGLAARVAAHPLWYHTMELAPGVVTPGWFDLREAVERLPWPDVTGRRCLDIGTWDGFLAFELERRGASEVVATDIAGPADWDHLPRQRADAVAYLEEAAGTQGGGFAIAAEALGSTVERRVINIYDLSPERMGTFDVVVCGALMLHLRNPFEALAAVRSVCSGAFLSSEQIDPQLSVLSRKRPALFVDGDDGRWTIPNAAGHARMLEIAGFDVLQRTTLSVPFGAGHPPTPTTPRAAGRRLVRRLAAGGTGVPYSGVLCRPAV